MHARVIIWKTINQCNDSINQCRNKSFVALAAMPLEHCHLCHFYFFDFFTFAQTINQYVAQHRQQVALLASCGGGLLASAACTQGLKLETINRCNNSVDQRCHWLTTQPWRFVVAMTQQSEQCCPCHSAEVLISFFDCLLQQQKQHLWCHQWVALEVACWHPQYACKSYVKKQSTGVMMASINDAASH